jgi:hypothetical protein
MSNGRQANRPVVSALVAVLVCAAGAIGGHAASPPAGTRRALLVGIDKYLHPPQGARGTVLADTPRSSGRAPGAIFDLEGTNNDVQAMKAVLVARYDFKPENVHLLLNSDATRERILAEVSNWLVRTPSAGDVSLFFYAGHGSQVKNSKSQELDQLDETIVPADAPLGRQDIRDKELAKLFDQALDKKIVLTTIFDSCHSGSIARGLTKPGLVRTVDPDPRDVADPETPVAPETRGALVLSAALDVQTAGEVRVSEEADAHHGLFTWALVRTLSTMPVNASADRIYLSLRGLMQSERTQEPVLAGTPERKRAPLLGIGTVASAGLVVAAQTIQPDGSIVLQGGRAIGLRTDAELKPLDSAAPPSLMLRVVEEQGLTLSRAQVVGGTAESIKPGMLFRVSQWSMPAGQSLQVWMTPSTLTRAQLAAQAPQLAALSADSRVTWIDDPTTADGPISTLGWRGAGWQVSDPTGKPLGSPSASVPSADLVASIVPADATGMRRVRIDVPAPTELAQALRASSKESGMFEMASSLDRADYVLIGRVRNGTPGYAMVRPLMTAADARTSALPALTNWVPLAADAPAAAAQLRELAERLNAVRTWLQLQSPADPGTFPYRLALKNTKTGEIKIDGPAAAGDHYGLVLRLDESMNPPSVERRFVYVFDIDQDGTSVLLFPRDTSGGVENLLPLSTASARLPQEIPLGPADRFGFSAGTDTFIMLTTAQALPDPGVLEGGAVRTESTRGVGRGDALSMLLRRGGTRSVGLTTPADWSIQNFTIRTPGR